jgi:hypothetical protein
MAPSFQAWESRPHHGAASASESNADFHYFQAFAATFQSAGVDRN